MNTIELNAIQAHQLGRKHYYSFGIHDENTYNQFANCMRDDRAITGVLCADGHLGYAHPIGGVIAYRDAISISGVGFDIGCGNYAIRTDADPIDVQEKISIIMDDVQKNIEFGIGKSENKFKDHKLFDDSRWETLFLARQLKSMARSQLGTVGSGNHYVDIFISKKNEVWIGVHFGSRGFGHKTAKHFMNVVGAKDEMNADPAILNTNSDLGRDYLSHMELAGDYAATGRECVAHYVAQKILGANALESIHNHHNFAWREQVFGEYLYVVRKGATPAFPGQRGFVGGSMGDNAVIIEGVESEQAINALHSTIHGAGRIMSRGDAKGRYRSVDGKKIREPGKVRHDDMMKWLHDFKVEVRGGDLDEAPQAYRRLDEVLEYHKDSIKVLEVLKPIGVCMAGKDVKDPYKD